MESNEQKSTDSFGWTTGYLKPSLKLKTIHVWRIVLPIQEEIREKFEKILSSDEHFRLNKFHFKIDRERFLTARGGLRNIIARYLNIPPKDISFNYTKFGKPYLSNSRLRFNVSHSGNYILYAITQDDHIGIDVEECKRDIDFLSMAKQIFSESEYNKFLTVLPAERWLAFYRYWTRKEAILKAMGKGLYFPLTQLEVSFLPYEQVKVLKFLGKIPTEGLWQLHEVQLDKNYIASIAIKRNYHKLYLWNYTPNSSSVVSS